MNERRGPARARAPGDRVVGAGEFAQFPDFVPAVTCRDWKRRVLADRAGWSRAFGSGWTYGLAWYVFLESGLLHEYHHRAPWANRRLRRLPGFVAALRRAAGRLTGPGGERGLPTRARRENLGEFWCDAGAHINGTSAGGVPHADYEGLSPYPERLFDARTLAFSAVLSLSTPEQGGGLSVWRDRRLADAKPRLTKRARIELDYTVGTLTIFDSFLYHCVRPLVRRRSYRITGVMHFLYLERPYPHWEYWF